MNNRQELNIYDLNSVAIELRKQRKKQKLRDIERMEEYRDILISQGVISKPIKKIP